MAIQTNAPALAWNGAGRQPAVERLFGAFGEYAFMTMVGVCFAGLPVALHLIHRGLAFAAVIACSAGLAWLWPRAIPLVLFFVFGFQSSFIAMTSPLVQSSDQLEPMKIYSLLTAVIFWIVVFGRYLNAYQSFSPFVHRLVKMGLIVALIVGPYAIGGMLFDARASVIYARNIGLPILLFQTCLLIAAQERIALPVIAGIVLSALLICGYLEILALDTWFSITNGLIYWDLTFAGQKEAGTWIKAVGEGAPVVTETLDLLKPEFLNFSFLRDFNLTIVRLQGPNFHPISFGYIIAILGSVLVASGRYLLPMLMIPVLLMASAKGAIVLFVLTTSYCFAAKYIPDRRIWWGLFGLLCIYGATAFLFGLRSGDYHVLGLLGGLNGFLHNPFGHTLGQGGNLSINFATLDWSKFQASGAADVAIESAVGVMLFQLGIAAIALLLVYLWLSRLNWRLYQHFRSPMLAWSSAAIAVMLINGFFQEEALFAPLSFASVLAIVGISLGAVDRAVVGRGQEGIAQMNGRLR